MQNLTTLQLKQSPYKFTLASMPDVTPILSDVNTTYDIYDFNLFLLKNPKLLADEPRNRNDGQPNDVKKLSLKTMSDYILNFGIMNRDPGFAPITITTNQRFKTISYIYDGIDDVPRNNRPATLNDVFNLLRDSVFKPILDTLLDDGAFDTKNDLTPDYALSLDTNLTDSKLTTITEKAYTEEHYNDFMYLGDADDFISRVPDGMLEPKSMTVTVKHTHDSILYTSPDAKTNAITTNGDVILRNESGASRITDGAVESILARRYGGVKVINTILTPYGATHLEAGDPLNPKGDFEDKINANSISATCLPNENAQAVNYIQSLDKVSVRFKARRYRVFKKQE